MKFTLHKKIAGYFGYEFVKIRRMVYRDINSHLLGLFDSLKINCVFDVGANMGQFALNLRSAGYKGQLISFEPIKQCYEHIKQYEDDNWKIVNYALGSDTGNVDINVTNKNVFSSILPPNEYSSQRFKDSIKIDHVESIEVKRIDDVFQQLTKGIGEPRIFLKLDTQGYDLEVMRGASESLQFIYGIQSEISCKPIYEGMPGHIEALNYFCQLGYEITGIFPLSHDKNDLSLLEFDCVFRKK